jgi:hypothetical protein
VDVRRLAAVDMWGLYGRRWRRWVILGEFLGVALVGIVFGLYVATAGDTLGKVIGWWIVAASANYLPLSAYALLLSRPGRLEAELRDVDVPAELRYYSLAQFWAAVPLALVYFALRPGRRERDGA